LDGGDHEGRGEVVVLVANEPGTRLEDWLCEAGIFWVGWDFFSLLVRNKNKD